MILESRDIIVRYARSAPLHFPDIKLAAGGRLLLRGPSGAGKTTLLSVLAGLLRPAQGQVVIDGEDLYALSSGARDRCRGRKFGFVFQNLHLLPALTLRQNVLLAADMAGVTVPDGRLDQLLDGLGLTDKAQRRPEALSHGEQQRAAIARAALLHPPLIVADEPTSALDDASAQMVMTLLEQQAQESGAALIVATHDSRIIEQFPEVIHLEASLAQEVAA